MVAASEQGPEAVRQVMKEISPDNPDWVQAASDLIRARKNSIPHFIWEDPEFGGTICFPPTERPLRKILNAQRKKSTRTRASAAAEQRRT